MKNFILFILFFMVIPFLSCSKTKDEPKTDPGITPATEIITNPISIKIDQKTYLYGTKAAHKNGDWTIQSGDNMRWKGNSEITWQINVVRDERFNLYLNAWIPESSKNISVILTTGSESVEFQLQSTKGLGLNGQNFERIKYSPQVRLKKGIYEIVLKSTNIAAGTFVMDLRALELEPVAALPQINADLEKAIASRASTEWLTKAGYGVMFHWTSQSINPDGSHKTYFDAVNSFYVDKFANMVEETGAGYVIFTIGHAEQYCPAPIASWDKCHPGRTTQRDLIGEIADALNAKGIRLILYMHSYGTARFKIDDNPTFFTNFKSILNEFGNRYKERLAGYWFDCWYQISEGYPEIPFEEFFNATKIGNKDRIIALNSWIYPPVTPWQEYWAGEVASPVAIPINGFMTNGPVPDLRYQALLIMEPYWVQEKAEMPDPRFTSTDLSQYIRNCMNQGGAVTINMGIYQDGTVGEKALKVMKEVRQQIRTKK